MHLRLLVLAFTGHRRGSGIHKTLLVAVTLLLTSCAGDLDRYYIVSDGVPNFGARVMADRASQKALEQVLYHHGFTKDWDTPPYTVAYGKPKGKMSPVPVSGSDGAEIMVGLILLEKSITVSHSHVYLRDTMFAAGIAQRVAKALQSHYPGRRITVTVEDGWSNPW